MARLGEMEKGEKLNRPSSVGGECIPVFIFHCPKWQLLLAGDADGFS